MQGAYCELGTFGRQGDGIKSFTFAPTPEPAGCSHAVRHETVLMMVAPQVSEWLFALSLLERTGRKEIPGQREPAGVLMDEFTVFRDDSRNLKTSNSHISTAKIRLKTHLSNPVLELRCKCL